MGKIEKIRSILFKDNIINRPIKFLIRKIGLYPLIYKFLDKFGLHNEISFRFIKKCVNKENPIILEIGCNVGQDTKRFLKVFNNPKIYCFEPDPRCIKKFKENIDKENVKLIEIAISNKNGTITFHQSSGVLRNAVGEELIEDYMGSGTIKTPDYTKIASHVKYKKDIEVPTMRLDDWAKMNNIKKIDFIWLDVEGAEREAIEGAINILNKTRYFYTEFFDNETYIGQPTHFEIQKMLPNFRTLGIFGNNILMENKLIAQK